VPDTVVLVCLKEGGRAYLLDVFMSKGINVRDETWKARYDEMIRLHARMSSEAKDLFPVGSIHRNGFMKLYDSSSGGLILRATGQRKPIRCQEV
jgi:hypothetical protein